MKKEGGQPTIGGGSDIGGVPNGGRPEVNGGQPVVNGGKEFIGGGRDA